MPPRTAYVSFQTGGAPPLTIAGRLSLPTRDEGAAPGPAVVICHGSDGVDGRGEFYAPGLNAIGLATLEIDMWAARGSARGAAARPRSPIDTLPDAFGALRFLAVQPEIDPGRIGIMGFSWGGVVTLLCAMRRHRQAFGPDLPGFAAHAANYPVCWAYGRVPALSLEDPTGAPILLQTGEADAYDSPGAGGKLAEALTAVGASVTHIAHPAASHGFDRDLPAQTIVDPFAYEGAGGPVLMEFNPAAAGAAREAVTTFFEGALGA
jgi:dienelactone hydrolase